MAIFLALGFQDKRIGGGMFRYFILYVCNCVKQTARRHTRTEKPIGWFPRPTIKPQFSQHRCKRSHDAEVLWESLAVRWWCLRWGYRWRWRWWWLDWLVSGDRLESVTGDWWRLLSSLDCTSLHALPSPLPSSSREEKYIGWQLFREHHLNLLKINCINITFKAFTFLASQDAPEVIGDCQSVNKKMKMKMVTNHWWSFACWDVFAEYIVTMWRRQGVIVAGATHNSTVIEHLYHC